jgi:hypothetical protein
MTSMGFSVGVLILVIMVFVGGFLYLQYYTVSGQNSDLRKTLNATEVDNAQLHSQLSSLQQLVTSLQVKIDELQALIPTEKLSISSAYAANASGGVWAVNLVGLNNGSAAASISQILVNGSTITGSWMGCAGSGCSLSSVTSLNVSALSSFSIRFSISTSAYTSGQTIDVRVVTAASSYLVQVVLPGASVQGESISVNVANATAITSPVAGWAVMIAGRNTALSSVLFEQIQINGVPVPDAIGVSVNGSAPAAFANASVSSGGTFAFVINLPAAGFSNLTFTKGQTIEVRLVTARGSYPQQVKLSASTQYEDVQVNTAYAVASGSGSWAVVIGGLNAGTGAATVQQIQVNGQAAGSLSGGIVMSSLVNGDVVSYPGTIIPAGATFNYIITVFGVSAGQTIQVKIITAQGTYPVQVPTS